MAECDLQFGPQNLQKYPQKNRERWFSANTASEMAKIKRQNQLFENFARKFSHQYENLLE